MENNSELFNDRKLSKRTKSSVSSAPTRVKDEPAKHTCKSFNDNEAVKSVDLALGRLKKSKLVTGESTPRQMGPAQGAIDIFMDSNNTNNVANVVSHSVMSMNFSQYELMRNLSHCQCNSDGNFSGNSVHLSPIDVHVRNERLEKYFRSIEMCPRRQLEERLTTINTSQK